MKSWGTFVWIGIGVILGIYLILFGLQNTMPVPVDLVVVPKNAAGEVQTRLPLYGVIAISFALGALIVGTFSVGAWVKRARERRRLLRRIGSLEEELGQLRNAPLEDVPRSDGGDTPPPSA